jgi:hypothetical protein
MVISWQKKGRTASPGTVPKQKHRFTFNFTHHQICAELKLENSSHKLFAHAVQKYLQPCHILIKF